jgi:hypothetical protein
MTFNRWIDLGLIFALVLWASLHLFFAEAPYVVDHFAPKMSALGLYLVACALVMTLRDPVLRLFGFVWTVWPVVGSYFSVGHFYLRFLWAPLDLAEPNQIFLLGTIAVLAGLHVYLLFHPLAPSRSERIVWTPFEMLPLLVFPLAYAVILLASGSTLLSGGSIVDQMYEVNRGPLYGLRIALVMTLLWLALHFQRSGSSRRWLIVAAMAGIFFVSVLDGKRDMALLGVLGIMSMALINMRHSRRTLRLIMMMVLFLGVYGVIGSLRAERGVEFSSWIQLATIAGIEYRDFAHSINYWSPEYMSTFGYDYLRSAFGSLLSGDLLAAFNFNKSDLVATDSARTWQRAFQSEFGIRTGLPSELYFAFPATWPVFLGLFGAFVGVVRNAMNRSQSEMSYIVATTAFAALTLSVFSQSTAAFGYVMTIGYLIAMQLIWRLFSRAVAASLRPVKVTPKH